MWDHLFGKEFHRALALRWINARQVHPQNQMRRPHLLGHLPDLTGDFLWRADHGRANHSSRNMTQFGWRRQLGKPTFMDSSFREDAQIHAHGVTSSRLE